MIGVDWGTSAVRAYRLSPDATVLERVAAPRGIMQVEGGAFAEALAALVGPWLAAGETRIVLSGMIGSRQGWREVPYLPCPVGPDELARALTPVEIAGAQAFIVPGLTARTRMGEPEIMRGEETQIAGMVGDLGAQALVCLPGTHSKWAEIADGRIAGFTTAMTGEVFAVLRTHSILGREMTGDAHDPDAFDRGVARSGGAGGLLHHLFGARSRVVTGAMGGAAAASFLSGLLVGHECRAALEETALRIVHLVGAPTLTALYGRALAALGAVPIVAKGDAAAVGLARIGALAPWT